MSWVNSKNLVTHLKKLKKVGWFELFGEYGFKK